MTSEIALLNRSAVALAADSAVTVRYWEHGKQQTRYNKGANKLFHLSPVHPVGMMIYAAASCQGVPWELLAKWYRDGLDGAALATLDECATEFLKYVEQHPVFPADFQTKQFKSDVRGVAGRILANVLHDDGYKQANTDAEKSTEAARVFAAMQAKLNTAAFVGNAVQADVDKALVDHRTSIEQMLREDQFYSRFHAIADFATLSDMAIRGLFLGDFTTLSESGIVIAGFGQNDYFPKLRAFQCYGIVLGKLIYSPLENKACNISQEEATELVPFAQDDMISTFIYGVSMPGLMELDVDFIKGVDLLEEQLKKDGLLSPQADIERYKQVAKEKFAKEAIGYFWESHTSPLRRAVGGLSIRELAELAETLVSLESLKERVTRPSDSVSGPIDVAVISKSDGFIWVKRKHYFDPELNPRFFSRKSLKR